jgi:hypothetical protein
MMIIATIIAITVTAAAALHHIPGSRLLQVLVLVLLLWQVLSL